MKTTVVNIQNGLLAKKDGRTDAFFFSSVTQSYLNAALCAL